MRGRLFFLNLSILLLTSVAATVSFSDDFTQHFIAARAGVLNYMEGRPTFSNGDSGRSKKITANTQLAAGDVVETQDSDRLEMLLNPGSFLRLGPGSRLRVINTDYADMRFELDHGTAIIESATFNKKVHGLALTTAAGTLRCLKDGLYRVDVSPQGEVQAGIRKGKLAWTRDGAPSQELSSGKSYTLLASESGKPQSAKLQKGELDTLDQWSRRRAEFLVAANSRLSPWTSSGFSRAYAYNLRGAWMYNPFYNCYTFLPYDGIFGSPYGFTYGLYYPVRRFGYYDGYSRPGSGGGTQSTPTSPTARNTTANQRTQVRTAPSSPSMRGDVGRGDQGSRGGSYGRMRNR